MSKEKRLSLIVPVYYEEEVLPIAYPRMKAAMEQTGHDYEIIFVNDGSRDGTMRELRRIAAEDKRVKVVDIYRYDAVKDEFYCTGNIPHKIIEKARDNGVYIPESLFKTSRKEEAQSSEIPTV